LHEVSRGFSWHSSCKSWYMCITWSTPRPLHSKSFRIHYSFITPPFDAIRSVTGGKGQYSGRWQYRSFLAKKNCICTCVLFRTGSEIEPFHCTERETRHVLTRVAKCIDVDGGIFENVLY
jgi:hypothetical protein